MISPVAEVAFIDTSRSPSATDELGFKGITQVILSNADMERILLAAPFAIPQGKVDGMTLMDKQYFIKTAVEQGTIDTLDLLPPAIEDADDPVDEVHPYGTVWIAGTSGNTFQTDGTGNWQQINT